MKYLFYIKAHIRSTQILLLTQNKTPRQSELELFCKGQIAAGDGTFEEPTADGIDGGVAAVGEDDDADWMVRRETDPGAAVVAAAIFFEVASVYESQRPAEGVVGV